ncbi:MAG: Ig-like domain-containing protein, partial [Acidimicrobiales bacterium]
MVTVRANGAHLAQVQVRAVSGALEAGATALAGHLDAVGHEWHSIASLLPDVVYLVRYQVTGTGGLSTTGSGTFGTAPPVETVRASVFPTPGITVGIGQPIVLTFSHPVDTYAAQQAVLSRLQLAMSKPVPGGWHWFSSVELHFRPARYWPVGEQVRLSGDLDGWDLGGGKWGEGQISTAFVVGPSHISTVDLAAHEMTVTSNGQVVYTWPISAGAPQWPTMDGTHVVLDRDSVVRMDSASVGIPVNSPAGYDELVYWDVHISDSGEYV